MLVMGGGLAGLCTAYYLARDGVDVLLAERDEAGMAASTANAGSLHVQLLSYDFNDETPEDGGQAAHTLPLAPRSIALWKEIAAEAGEALGIRTEGGLMLAEDAESMDWLRRKSAMEQRWGIESHVLGANELRDARARAVRTYGRRRLCAGRGLRRPAARHDGGAETGATCRRPRLCAAPRSSRSSATASHGTCKPRKGMIIAGRVVNATGPWSASVGKMVGLDLPVTGTVQQVIVTEPAPPMTKHLIALANRHLSLKQQASGGFLIGGGWFGGLRSGHWPHPQPAPQHRGQSLGLRACVAGAAQPVVRSCLDRYQLRDRPRADNGRGAWVAGVLQRDQRQRLHARPDHRTHHSRRGARRSGRRRITGWIGSDNPPT